MSGYAQGPKWVIRVILTAGGSLPVCPGKQTFWSSVGMSQRGQLLTRAMHIAFNSCLSPVVQLM
jgi:hypothetical protein